MVAWNTVVVKNYHTYDRKLLSLKWWLSMVLLAHEFLPLAQCMLRSSSTIASKSWSVTTVVEPTKDDLDGSYWFLHSTASKL